VVDVRKNESHAVVTEREARVAPTTGKSLEANAKGCKPSSATSGGIKYAKSVTNVPVMSAREFAFDEKNMPNANATAVVMTIWHKRRGVLKSLCQRQPLALLSGQPK